MTQKEMTGMAGTVERIQRLYERRSIWHREEKSLGLQIRAHLRKRTDGDIETADALYDEYIALSEKEIAKRLLNRKLAPSDHMTLATLEPLLLYYRNLAKRRAHLEEQLELNVIALPIYTFAAKTTGFAAGSLAAIIGSAGNLWNYPRVQKLWKRMGLAVDNDGLRQRNKRGAAPEANSYSPERRAVMWTIGTALLMTQSARIDKETGVVKREAGDYRKIFDRRRAYEDAKNDNGDYAPIAAKMMKVMNFTPGTTSHSEYGAGKLPKAHLKARAQRYMEKQLLKHLWSEWRRTMIEAKPTDAEMAAAASLRTGSTKAKAATAKAASGGAGKKEKRPAKT